MPQVALANTSFFAAACLIWSALGSVATAGQEPGLQFADWRVGRSWNVVVEPMAQPDPARYRFGVHVGNPEQVDGVECWRVIFVPGDHMPGEIPRHLALFVDKHQRWARRGFPLPLTPTREFDIRTIDQATVVTNAPDDVPIELFPLAPARDFSSTAGLIKLESIRTENETFATLTYLVDSQQKLRVRQRWRDGDGWWRYYEKHVDGKLRLRARAFNAPPLEDIFAKLPPSSKIIDNPLRFDERLSPTIHVGPRKTSVEHILELLRGATGLDITLGDSLKDHQPDFAVQGGPNGWHAWQLMGILAKVQ